MVSITINIYSDAAREMSVQLLGISFVLMMPSNILAYVKRIVDCRGISSSGENKYYVFRNSKTFFFFLKQA